VGGGVDFSMATSYLLLCKAKESGKKVSVTFESA